MKEKYSLMLGIEFDTTDETIAAGKGAQRVADAAKKERAVSKVIAALNKDNIHVTIRRVNVSKKDK